MSFEEDVLLSSLRLPVSVLPPKICNNPRKKIQAEEVDPTSLIIPVKHHRENPKNIIRLVPYPPAPSAQPCPRYPLSIIWSPDRLYFELYEEPIILKLWIWNGCAHTIYIHCCGLWDDTARLGASWRTYPRTRFYLAPGLKSELFVKATPRILSPVPCANVGLQLAASHLRDNVTGYFAVPVVAKFLKYKAPCFGEGG